MSKKRCINQCPHCEGDNINYNSPEIVHEMTIYSAICNDCQGKFTEEYSLRYIITTY